MKIDVNKVLEQLATAFNTTVEQLYPILIKQAYVAGVQAILFFLLSAATVATILYLANKSREKRNEKHGYDSWEWADEGVPYAIALIVPTMLLIISVFEVVFTVPTAFFNPEYWAIQEILDKVTSD